LDNIATLVRIIMSSNTAYGASSGTAGEGIGSWSSVPDVGLGVGLGVEGVFEGAIVFVEVGEGIGV
jgi:hypothetical protein